MYKNKYLFNSFVKMRKNSFYDWHKMNPEEMEYHFNILNSLFEDHIILSDWFSTFRQLIAPNDISSSHDLHIERQLNGLQSLFIIAGIHKEEHRIILEDLTYELVATSRTMSMTVEERAAYLFHAWKEKITTLSS